MHPKSVHSLSQKTVSHSTGSAANVRLKSILVCSTAIMRTYLSRLGVLQHEMVAA